MDSQTIISILTYGFLGVGGLLLAALVWFLNRTVSQLETLAKLSQEHTKQIAVLQVMVGRRHHDNSEEIEP